MWRSIEQKFQLRIPMFHTDCFYWLHDSSNSYEIFQGAISQNII